MATTVYIAPTAQGSADGTSEANAYAFSSLATAENDAGSGGTLYFLDGDYNLTGNVTFNEPGLTYQSLNKNRAIFKTNGATRTLTITGTGGSTETFKDFRFEGDLASNYGFIVSRNAGTSDKLVFSGVYMDHAGSSTPNTAAFNFYNKGLATFEYSSFRYVAGGTSVYFYTNSSTSPSQPFILNHCSLYNPVNGGATKIVVSTNGTYTNTIFVATGTNSSDNITSYSTNCCFFEYGGVSSGGTNNLFVDPEFVDQANGDLRLRPSSPCIGAGTAS